MLCVCDQLRYSSAPHSTCHLCAAGQRSAAEWQLGLLCQGVGAGDSLLHGHTAAPSRGGGNGGAHVYA